MKRKSTLTLALFTLVTAMLACGVPGTEPTPNATIQALSQSLNNTATAVAAPTNTPAPDATFPADDPGAAVGTAQAQATQLSQSAAATRDFQATTAASNADATAQAFQPIMQELQSYGIDTSQGRLAWMQPPLTLFVEGYLQYDFDVEFVTVAHNFVVASDITWNTQFGSTGCGYVVRSDADEEAGNRYFIVATRGGNGRVLSGVQLNGNLVLDDSVDIYANGIDPAFEWQNDTTNRLVVIGRENTFSIYTNGTFLGDFTPESASFERGFVAFVALNESGTTTCTFTNGYLWLIN
ncbi:MAG: hypothetical protein WAM60_08275 [Candidatus Promineifilaceae bacterium]